MAQQQIVRQQVPKQDRQNPKTEAEQSSHEEDDLGIDDLLAESEEVAEKTRRRAQNYAEQGQQSGE